MGSLTSTLPICTMMTVSPIMSMDALAAPVEETIIHQKFGEMELPEDEETEDVDYSPSDAESDDSLEWASETERTKAEDALVEGKVGIDFYGAAMAVATEYVAGYRPVQMGLGLVSAVPIPSVIVSIINSIISMLGFQLAPAVEDSSKPHLEPGTEPYSPEQEFGEMTLSDYDSNEDADYAPNDSDTSSELEYDSGATVSSASEAAESGEEALATEE